MQCLLCTIVPDMSRHAMSSRPALSYAPAVLPYLLLAMCGQLRLPSSSNYYAAPVRADCVYTALMVQVRWLTLAKLLQEHLFLVCELLRANLYEFQKYNRDSVNPSYFVLQRV